MQIVYARMVRQQEGFLQPEKRRGEPSTINLTSKDMLTLVSWSTSVRTVSQIITMMRR